MTAIDRMSPSHQALANLQLSPKGEQIQSTGPSHEECHGRCHEGLEAAICTVTPEGSAKPLSCREAIEITAEYDAIRSEKDKPFSELEGKYGLPKLLAALPKDVLKAKFDAEFSEMPEDPEFLRSFDLVKMAAVYTHQLISDGQMDQIKQAFSFSDLAMQYDLDLLLPLFGLAELRQKFNAEFGAASDIELLAKVELPTLDKMARAFIVPEERMESIRSLPDEALWPAGKLYSQLLEKHGLDSLKKCYSAAFLEQKSQSEIPAPSQSLS